MVYAHWHIEQRRIFEQSIFHWSPIGLLKKLGRKWKGRRLAAKSSLQRKEIGRVRQGPWVQSLASFWMENEEGVVTWHLTQWGFALFAGRATLFFSRMCPSSVFRPGHWPFSALYLLKPDACKENISFSREKLEEKNILCVFQGNFNYSIQ